MRSAVSIIFLSIFTRTDGQDSSNGIGDSMFEKPDCYNDLRLLDDHMALKDSFVPEEYILCPNTIFRVGFVPRDDHESKCCDDGTAPLYAASNAKVLCGKDGSSDNNCTITGGVAQFSTILAIIQEPVESMLLSGITFESSFATSLIFSNTGDVTVKDCIFKNHTQGAPVVLTSPTDTMARMLQQTNSHRMGQESGRQRVVFDSVQFLYNEVNPIYPGVVTTTDAFDDLEFINCTFKGNDFSTQERSYAIEIYPGSTLKMEDTCFLDNEFDGDGIILASSTEDLELTNNHVSNTVGTTCAFVSVEGECLDFDAPQCASSKDLTEGNGDSSYCRIDDVLLCLLFSALVWT